MAVLDCCMTLKVIPPWQANHTYLFLMWLGVWKGVTTFRSWGGYIFWEVGTEMFEICLGGKLTLHITMNLYYALIWKEGSFGTLILRGGHLFIFFPSLPKWVLEGVPYGEGTFNWRLALSLHMSYEHFHTDLLGGKIRLLFEIYEELTCKVLVYKI